MTLVQVIKLPIKLRYSLIEILRLEEIWLWETLILIMDLFRKRFKVLWRGPIVSKDAETRSAFRAIATWNW